MKQPIFTKITFDFGNLDEKIEQVLKKRHELEKAAYELRDAITDDGVKIEIKKSPNLPVTNKDNGYVN